MIELTMASWRQHRRRYVATFLAILLGVGFCAATLALNAAAKRGAGDAAAIQYSKADVVAFPDAAPSSQLVGRLGSLSQVASVAVVTTALVDVGWPSDHAAGTEQVSDVASSAALRWQQLAAGDFPVGPGQVAVDADLAKAKGVQLGSSLEIRGAHGATRSVTVVGLVQPEKGADTVSPLLAAAGALSAWGASGASSEIDFLGASGVSQPALADQVRRALPSAAVATTDSLRLQAVSGLSNDVDVLGRIFEAFAVVALFVAGLVISNTFRIVMTQRIRDLALLRCVGAERWQVFVMTIGEASLLGVVAALAGTTAGVAFGALVVEVLNHTSMQVPLTFAVPGLPTLALPFLGGLVMVLAAALAPAAWAARVAPLAALRPGGQVTMRSRGGPLQLTAGVLLGLAGCLLLGLGVLSGQLLPGLAGGLFSFAGVLVLTPFVVPGAIRLVGGARRFLPRRLRGGVPAELSVLNAVRNPRRTAATAAALLVGVTLIAMMSVGAASVSATESQALDRVTPVDLTVAGGAVPPGLVEAARRVDGVREVVAAPGATLRTSAGAVEVGSLSPAAAAAVVRDQGLRTQLADRSTVVVPVSAQGEVPGGGSRPFTLRSGDHRVRVTPVYSNLTSGPLLVAPSVLESLGGRLHPVALYLRVSDGADPESVVASVQDTVASVSPHSTLAVDGGYVKRSTYDRAISVMLLVATAMLAMSVLIALVGVGNTLSLSILERTREHGLMRALGLTTGQLRLLLASEAVLMAGTAAVIGTALGVGYGWVGTLTLLHGTTNQSPTLALPLGRLALIVAVAVVAGLLASVLPARRAVRVSPALALSEN